MYHSYLLSNKNLNFFVFKYYQNIVINIFMHASFSLCEYFCRIKPQKWNFWVKGKHFFILIESAKLPSKKSCINLFPPRNGSSLLLAKLTQNQSSFIIFLSFYWGSCQLLFLICMSLFFFNDINHIDIYLKPLVLLLWIVYCFWLNYVPPKFISWSPNPQHLRCDFI